MMTGMLPFDGETMGEVLVKQVTQLPPPLRGFNGQIPPSVEQIVLRCLAKQPDQRFPTMLALREALLDPEAYLRNSPPMSPARSLAPGEVKVDAKTIMAYAAQEQKATQIGVAGAPLPLAAPPPSNPGTNAAKTMIADGSMVPPRAPAMPGHQAPEMIAPQQPKMNTMRIATPMGYSSRPPRKMWPIVLVVALLLGLGGGAAAVAYFGKSDEPAAPAPVAHDAHVDAPAKKSAPPDAAVAVAPIAADAAPIPTAIIVIDSTPQGADVIGPDKQALGKTPAQVTLPISDLPLTFELRLAGYKKKTKQVIVTGNTVISVPLDKAASPSGGSTSHKKGSGNGNELMRPDDL
jgi:hypothetical protein